MAKTRPKSVVVKTYTNWCEIDCYGEPKEKNGQLLNQVKDGDRVDVLWPDESVLGDVKVIVEKRTRTISDMGTPYRMPIETAYVMIDHHGQTLKIPLKGIMVRRI